jgi:hypothetical protein
VLTVEDRTMVRVVHATLISLENVKSIVGFIKSCEVSWSCDEHQSELVVQRLFQTIVRHLNVKIPDEQKRCVGIAESVANYCSDMLCVVKH